MDKFLDLYALLFIASTSALTQLKLGHADRAEQTLKSALSSGWQAAGADQQKLMSRVFMFWGDFVDKGIEKSLKFKYTLRSFVKK